MSTLIEWTCNTCRQTFRAPNSFDDVPCPYCNGYIEWTCDDCGQTFWGPDSDDDSACPHCEVSNGCTCVSCGIALTLNAQEQWLFETGAQTNWWCSDCAAAADEVQQELDQVAPDQFGAGFEDIRQLVEASCAPLYFRRQTWGEWFRGVDPQAQQLEYKQWATDMANHLTEQRTAQLQRLTALANAARQFHRSKIDAQLEMARMRVEYLRLTAAEIQLREHINELQTLAAVRLENMQLREYIDRQKLLPGPAEVVDAEAEVIEEHRRHRRSHAHAGQAVVSDFLTEIEHICRRRIPVHEKALHIREVLNAFERDEESLPEKARRILRRAERSGDVA